MIPLSLASLPTSRMAVSLDEGHGFVSRDHLAYPTPSTPSPPSSPGQSASQSTPRAGKTPLIPAEEQFSPQSNEPQKMSGAAGNGHLGSVKAIDTKTAGAAPPLPLTPFDSPSTDATFQTPVQSVEGHITVQFADLVATHKYCQPANIDLPKELLYFPLPPNGLSKPAEFATVTLPLVSSQSTHIKGKGSLSSTRDSLISPSPLLMQQANWHTPDPKEYHAAADALEFDFEPAWSDTMSSIDPAPLEIARSTNGSHSSLTLTASGSGPMQPFLVSGPPATGGESDRGWSTAETKTPPSPPKLSSATSTPDGRDFEVAALKRQVEQLQYLLARRAQEDEAAAMADRGPANNSTEHGIAVPTRPFRESLTNRGLHRLEDNHANPSYPLRTMLGSPEPMPDVGQLAKKVAELELIVQGTPARSHRRPPRSVTDPGVLLSRPEHAAWYEPHPAGWHPDTSGGSGGLEAVPVPVAPAQILLPVPSRAPAHYAVMNQPRPRFSSSTTAGGREACRSPRPVASSVKSAESTRRYEPRPVGRPPHLTHQSSSSTVSTQHNFSYNVTPTTRQSGELACRNASRELDHVGAGYDDAGGLAIPTVSNSAPPSAASSASSRGRRVAFMPPAQIFLDGDNRPLIYRDGQYISLSQAFPEPVYRHGQSSSPAGRNPGAGTVPLSSPTCSARLLSSSPPPNRGSGNGNGGLHAITLAGLFGKAKGRKHQNGVLGSGVGGRSSQWQAESGQQGSGSTGSGGKMVVGPGRGRMLVKK